MLKTLSPIIALVLVFSCIGLSLHGYEAPSFAVKTQVASSLNTDDLETKALPSEKTTSKEGLGSTTLEKYDDPDDYEDGTYTGSATGFNGKITVAVTVKDGKIYSIKILSESDDAAWFSKAKKVINRIIAAQSTNVDTVSGATYSSVGIIKAVRNALKKAIKKSSKKDTQDSSDDDSDNNDPTDDQDSETPSSPGDDGNASLVEGTEVTVNGDSYTATVWCNPDEKNEFKSYKTDIVSTITIVDGVPQISNVAVANFKGASTDKPYITLAVKQINLKMPVISADDISTVSSATCSSYSIRAACRASLLKALENLSGGDGDLTYQSDERSLQRKIL